MRWFLKFKFFCIYRNFINDICDYSRSTFECELDSLRTSLLILWKEFKNLFLEGSHKINLEVLDEDNEPRTLLE